ncbi:MAG: hypothetical protein NW241_02950 [Bacteroidia bacterium]|nr:hypothetical protein [Bacteroidia bacterium]
MTACIWLMLAPAAALSQPGECRIRAEDLQPVIRRFNPYFSSHTWDSAAHLEVAPMGPGMTLSIAQHGCTRHHTIFTLLLEPALVTPADSFWVRQFHRILRRALWQHPEYPAFQHEVESLIADRFPLAGVNTSFNFPAGILNFICEVRYEPQRPASVRIEMIRFLFREKIEAQPLPGIPDAQDDGWKQP